MYKKQITELRKKCEKLEIVIQVKGGVETFDADFREKVLMKGFGYPTLEELKETFDVVNLLVGVKGQTLEQIEADIKIDIENFDRVCVNLYNEMDDIMPADEKLKARFMKEIYPLYKDFENMDILVENTDFGVGQEMKIYVANCNIMLKIQRRNNLLKSCLQLKYEFKKKDGIIKMKIFHKIKGKVHELIVKITTWYWAE